MLEIEIKCPCDDLAAVESKLIGLGAKPLGEVQQADVYLAHPCRDFGSTDEALRLRREGEEVTLHYKGPKLDKVSKSREEIGAPLVKPEAVRTIFDRLGFRPVSEVRKSRRSFVLGEVEVSLDSVAGLGGFVELEVQDRPLEEGRSMLFDLMKVLGLERTERRSYLELLLEKG
ncbi:MAG: class IV adenylate cyclase [Methanomassiliicoccus sp.]|nr:class IV adenylate cyclase [Methanomassiliicoccus sp.]